jgi:hypothetical protein
MEDKYYKMLNQHKYLKLIKIAVCFSFLGIFRLEPTLNASVLIYIILYFFTYTIKLIIKLTNY